MSKETYDGLFQEAEADTGVSWLLLKAQAIQESQLDPRAVSACGAQGISQFMPATWSKYGAGGNPFDPEDAIPAQGRYMRALLARFDYDALRALAAYNWGPTNIAAHIQKHKRFKRWRLPRETRKYLRKIEKYLAELKREQRERDEPAI